MNRRMILTGAICGVVILSLCPISGCLLGWMLPRTGYLIDIQTVLNKWTDVEEVKDIILNLEFRVNEPERFDQHLGYVTVYRKEFPQIREKENWIDIVFWYKPTHDIQGRQIKVTLFVWNYEIGNKVPFLKNQIDVIGDRVYSFLGAKVGKDNIKIRRTQSAFGYW